MNKLTAEKCREYVGWLNARWESEGLDDDEMNYLQALEIALPILEQHERGEGDWVDWGGKFDGNDQPVIGMVEVKLRNGKTKKAEACDWYWTHIGTAYDIIAYRIIPERATNQNGEQ